MDRCRRCYRQLKDPESVKRGLGPVCFGKSSNGSNDKLFNSFGQLELEFEQPMPQRFRGKTLMEQHAEACKVIFRRGTLD
jgi:hypothetical protein